MLKYTSHDRCDGCNRHPARCECVATFDFDAAEEQFSVHVKHMTCPHNAVTLEHDPRRLVCVECGEEVEPSWMR